jgi:uncharacterized protein (TIGR02453 family)
MKKYINDSFFRYFKKLAANNHRDWFESNRNEYETEVKKPFDHLVDALIFELAKTDKRFAGLQAKDCVFRINRDVRFSKDKSPYKLNKSAIISPGGKKNHNGMGFYFELGPEECGFYAGAYMPDTENLQKIRQHIAKNSKLFSAIITDLQFKKYFKEVLGDKQKRVDAAYKTAAEAQPLIYNKQFYIQHSFSEKIACGSNVFEYLLEVRKASEDFENFLVDATH